jgi:parallel beta-helix repeat protein
MELSNNNTISGNTAEYNRYGIKLFSCQNNTISGNTVNYNRYGIRLSNCQNNVISGNDASYNIYEVDEWFSMDTGSGITLEYHSNYNIVSGNIVYNNSDGIGIWESDNNTISGNIVKYNYNLNGIFLVFSDYNNVSGNTAIVSLVFSNYNIVTSNSGCVSESDDCQGNIISDNGPCPWDQG